MEVILFSDNMCMSGAGHKNGCFNQLLTCKVKLQPPALAPGISMTDISERVRGAEQQVFPMTLLSLPKAG